MASAPEQELTPDLRAILVGPIIMGDATQLILWGVLTTQAIRFTASPSWPKFSPVIRVAVVVVLFLATLSTITAVTDFWVYGTTFATVVSELENPLVVANGGRRKMYLLGLFTLIGAEAGFWAWTVYCSFETTLHPLHHINGKLEWAQSAVIWMVIQGGIDAFISCPAVFGISLLQTLAISDLSGRQARDANPYLQNVSGPDDVVLPQGAMLDSEDSYIGSKK
ncbi:hypothetical protein RQP46_011184 [Phenoliferia psychrophenolica]